MDVTGITVHAPKDDTEENVKDKKGDLEDTAKYLYVSLTSILCKTFEKLLEKSFFLFLTEA